MEKIGGFDQAGSELKYLINHSVASDKQEKILAIISEIIERIRENGLRE